MSCRQTILLQAAAYTWSILPYGTAYIPSNKDPFHQHMTYELFTLHEEVSIDSVEVASLINKAINWVVRLLYYLRALKD